MKKITAAIFMLAAVLASLTVTAGAAYFKPAEWVEESFERMISMGAVPREIVFSDYEGNITREEFANLIYTSYNRAKQTVYKPVYTKTYSDVYGESEALSAMYELAVMQGDDDGNFRPYDFITRQETAMVLSNFYAALEGGAMDALYDSVENFDDAAYIADWAGGAVNAVVSRGLMGDYGDNSFHPTDNVTINQAVSMLSRMIDAPESVRVSSFSINDGDIISSGTANTITWHGDGEYSAYIVTSGGGYVYSDKLDTDGASVTIGAGELNADRLYYLFVEKDNVFSKPLAFFTDNRTLQIDLSEKNDVFSISWNDIPDTDEYTVTVSEKRNTTTGDMIGARDDVVYTVTDNSTTLYANPVRTYRVAVEGGGYSDSVEFVTYQSREAYDLADMPIPQSQEEAEPLMKEIEINVWKIRNGEKVASKAWLTVHSALADRVYTIFQEIFEGEEKFPIESVGGYSWRGGRSEHNWGTAIDINPDQNYCLYSSGQIVGDHWLPYEDPYSITPYGEVMRAFERHGFTWGGDAWNSTKDYMHFSYFGT